MRVFVWKNYGSVEVFRAEGNEDRKNIFMHLYDVMRDFGIEEFFPESDIPLTTFTERNVYQLIDSFGEGTHELLEYGTGFTELKTLG